MFVRFTLRIIGRSQKHSFRSIIGFALIIAMMIATSGVISGFSARIFGITEKAGQSPSIYIIPSESSKGIPFDLPSAINHTNIKQILPVMERAIILASQTSTSELSIVGVNISELLEYYSHAEVYTGRAPQSNITPVESLLGKDVQKVVSSSEVNFTDKINGLTQELSIVGLIHNIKEFQRAILVEAEDFSRLFELNSSLFEYQRVKIKLKNGEFVEETISDLKILLKDHIHSLIIQPEQQANIFAESLFSDIDKQLTLFFSVLFIIALFRIFHTISWFVGKYEHDFLIMKSIGLSSFQIFFLVLLLAELIGISGLLMGFFFGILTPSLIFTLLELFFSGSFLVPEFSIPTIISLFVLSNLVIITAALYPAFIITRKKPNALSISSHSLDR